MHHVSESDEKLSIADLMCLAKRLRIGTQEGRRFHIQWVSSSDLHQHHLHRHHHHHCYCRKVPWGQRGYTGAKSKGDMHTRISKRGFKYSIGSASPFLASLPFPPCLPPSIPPCRSFSNQCDFISNQKCTQIEHLGVHLKPRTELHLEPKLFGSHPVRTFDKDNGGAVYRTRPGEGHCFLPCQASLSVAPPPPPPETC